MIGQPRDTRRAKLHCSRRENRQCQRSLVELLHPCDVSDGLINRMVKRSGNLTSGQCYMQRRRLVRRNLLSRRTTAQQHQETTNAENACYSTVHWNSPFLAMP